MARATAENPATDDVEAATSGSAADTRGATPMMAQYLAIKAEHPDHLLFYRMGDFYELFFDDAVQAAEALDIQLTRRGRHGDAEVPMAGVPVRSHDSYLERLIRAGFKVAICEQTEDPEEARRRGGGKALVRREVVRLVTPGTLTEDHLLDTRRHNFLATLVDVRGRFALARLDVSTGEFAVEALEPGDVASALARLEPSEILLPERLEARPDLSPALAVHRARITPLPDARFDSDNARRRLEALFDVATMDAFGAFSEAELAACGALVDYVELTQKGRLPRLGPPDRASEAGSMDIDPATRRSLELVRGLSGDRAGGLLAAIDLTVTGAGARMLADWLAAPLVDPDAITRRLDAVGWLMEQSAARSDLRRDLRQAPDLARALSRLTVGRGGPRDLSAIRDGLTLAARLRDVALANDSGAALAPPPDLIAETVAAIADPGPLVASLTATLADELPIAARDGGTIRAGYSDELDELRALRDDSRRTIAELQARYAEATGVSGLKVRHNAVLGYFVEVTPTHAARLERDERFVHRQTLASAVRFTTVELSELEGRISRAADRALALELGIVDRLIRDVAEESETIAATAAALACLDVLAGLAQLAEERRYCRPRVDGSRAFHIEGGRHPVVEAALARAGETFVANDCDLTAQGDEARLWLLTGPNMAGKSTFLRQNALIAVMAQMGSWVPAAAAHIGVVDRLFSRVGAADDLARGRSTFMVEMVETAVILNRAGPRALVILDEIGRGTATFDGLSIAWASIEHLHEANRCRGLFATHYHELTLLAERLDGLRLHTMRVKEWKGDVVFLHEVAEGAAEGSYGIHVARLAGLPPSVIRRARQVLARLQQSGPAGHLARLVDDLPLFAAAPEIPPERSGPNPMEEALDEVDPDALTPKAALELVYALKRLREG